ncbi:MAG: hypothetical protein LC685_00450 [Actinobacteria bacterium]|nr:hypothetical protein [Actinomycetota bacterium]
MDTRAPAVRASGMNGVRGRDDLLQLADLSLAAYLRYLARYGGASVEQDGLLLFAGPHRQPNPYRNGVLRLDDSANADDVVRIADAFFGPRRSGYALWAREHGDPDIEHAATASGFQELERLPELVLEELPAYLPPPDGVEIRAARDAQTRQDYLGLVAEAWGMGAMPREVAAKVFFDPGSLADPGVVAFVAYYDGMPLSAAMTLVAHGVALGCQAATLRRPKPGQRLPPAGKPGTRRGLAQSCLWAALERSFDELGAKLSLCQTSSLGAPVWLGLGYRPFTSYGRYLVPVRPVPAR